MDANLPDKSFPVPYPPPEPVPDSIDEQVDWMTYAHQELYRIVHEGLDVGGATSVSADWARLGDALGEIGDELHRIGQEFADAWQGEAAEQARHALTALAGWAQETGPRATEVSTLITLELDNAMRARDAMPQPTAPEPGPGPRAPQPATPDATVANAFSEPGFDSANLLLSDSSGIAGPSHQAHRQAAETMERFQADSRDVYYTVPQFSVPGIGPKPPGRDNPPPPAPQPTPPQQTPEGSPTGPGRPPAGPVPVGGVGGPSGGPGMPLGAPVATPSPAPAPRPELGAGSGAGTGPVPGEPGRSAAAAASANRPGAGGAAMGGMPMGGMGAGKPEDQERKSPAYLKEDEDLWGLGDHAVSPPVLGEDTGRA